MLEDRVTEKIIGCAIEVHRNLGPGLLEKIYENALSNELNLNGISFESQKTLPANYKNKFVGDY